jgi:hypothetical protein
MALTNFGMSWIASRMIGASDASANNSDGRLGVGNGITVQSPAVVTLQGASKAYQVMDPGFPTRTGGGDGAVNILTFQATFGPTEANFNWNEWGILSTEMLYPGRQCITRKVEYQGTKLSGQTWIMQATLTISAV